MTIMDPFFIDFVLVLANDLGDLLPWYARSSFAPPLASGIIMNTGCIDGWDCTILQHISTVIQVIHAIFPLFDIDRIGLQKQNLAVLMLWPQCTQSLF
jgi:hypothetical protein